MVTPALIGLGLAGGALLLLAMIRLARRPRDGALIRIVVETPRSPRRMLPAVGGAVARWFLDRQLRGGGPLGAFISAVADQRSPRAPGGRPIEPTRRAGHYET
jgi:hypothetical protein